MTSEFDIPRAEEYLFLLKDRLPEKTYAHVRSVARYMLTFHEEAGCTQEQAITAGLLHDACKAFTKENLRAHAVSFGVDEHLDSPNLLHGPAAAAECRQVLNITDDDVIEAIRYHTTGYAGWGAVGNTLYFADFAEPLRLLPEAKVARDMLEEQGFDVALRYVVEQKVAYVTSKYTVDPVTQAFSDWILAET